MTDATITEILGSAFGAVKEFIDQFALYIGAIVGLMILGYLLKVIADSVHKVKRL